MSVQMASTINQLEWGAEKSPTWRTCDLVFLKF